MKLSRLTTLLAAALALAACGGDGSPPPDPKYFSGPDDSIATRIRAASSLEEAATFEAAATAIRQDFDAGTVTQLPREPMTVRLFRPSPDTLSLVIETASGEFSFAPEDLLPSGDFLKEDYGSWASRGDWLGNANGYRTSDNDAIRALNFKFHVPYIFWDATTERSWTTHFGMIGLETSPGDMPQSKTAHFRGRGNVDFYQSAQPRKRENYHIADVSLTAYFANNKISGLLDDWVLFEEDGSESPTGISYQLTQTDIDGNGFSGSLEPSASCLDVLCGDMPNSSIAGKFYGPYAAEVGATIETGTFTDAEDVEWVGVGTFSAR